MKSNKFLSKIIISGVLSTMFFTGINVNPVNVSAAPVRYGDVNQDGLVNSTDYVLLERYVKNIVTLDDAAMQAADVNVDGLVNSTDYVIVKRYVLNIISELPYTSTTLTSYIGATSDIHTRTNNLNQWLTYTNVADLETMILGGDYKFDGVADRVVYDTSNTTNDDCFTAVKNFNQNTLPIMARGNHDKLSNDTFDTGLLVDPAISTYGVYVLDLQYPNSDFDQPTIKISDVDAIKAAISKTNKPFFVVSHCPIHYNNSPLERYLVNADYFLDNLASYSNLIFLWGHNHSQNDPKNGTVQKGGTIQYTSSATRSINFTYANMGSMKDGSGNAYGLLMKLTRGASATTVEFDFRNLDNTTFSAVSTLTLGN